MKRLLTIVDTSNSKYAVLKPAFIKEVTLSGFMGKYLKRTLEITLPTQYEILEETGRIDNFRRASGKIKKDFQGFFFNDSDVYKWVEAMSYALVYSKKDNNLEKMILDVINEIKDAQDEDGYLNTYFSFERKKDRWKDLSNMHELYCAGHLIQAAIAHKRSTGDNTLLDVAEKFADHIADIFGPSKKKGAPGHPEIEMALVELYRETGIKNYLKLAQFFLNERGKGLAGGDVYRIDHVPFYELDEVIGHAVRMLYLCCGATDIYLETGDRRIFEVLLRLWKNMVSKKMYITGGVGSRYEGEAFGENYELPNRRAYAETCAAIANFMWNWRMLLATGEGKFTDIMELALYNGILSGISLDGKYYFYVNPLEDRGHHRRKSWYDCACCPTNIIRILTSFPGYIYTTSDDGIWIHFYEEGRTVLEYSGSNISISQKTKYPMDGDILINVSTDAEKDFVLRLRIPEWAQENFHVEINGKELHELNLNKGYLRIRRNWKGSHEIHIFFPIKPLFMESHPFVRNNIEKIVVKRGPIVYCAEQVDNPDFDVWNLFVISYEETKEKYLENLLGGIVVLDGKGYTFDIKEWEGRLYKKFDPLKRKKEVEYRLIPYYAWANREPGPMTVWLNILHH